MLSKGLNKACKMRINAIIISINFFVSITCFQKDPKGTPKDPKGLHKACWIENDCNYYFSKGIITVEFGLVQYHRVSKEIKINAIIILI